MPMLSLPTKVPMVSVACVVAGEGALFGTPPKWRAMAMAMPTMCRPGPTTALAAKTAAALAASWEAGAETIKMTTTNNRTVGGAAAGVVVVGKNKDHVGGGRHSG